MRLTRVIHICFMLEEQLQSRWNPELGCFSFRQPWHANAPLLQARRSLMGGRLLRAARIFSMACRIPAVPSMLSCNSSSGLRAATRLRSSQSFLSFSSRASYLWTRDISTTQRPTLSKLNGKTSLPVHRNSVFSTSARRNVENQNGKDATSQYLSDAVRHSTSVLD